MAETPDAVAEGRRAEAVPEPALVVLALGERQRLGGAVSEADIDEPGPAVGHAHRQAEVVTVRAGRLLHATTVHSGDVRDIEAQPREKGREAPFRW